MSKADELRKIADNCQELAQASEESPKKKRLERLADGWKKLAQNQAWLDGDPDPQGPQTA
jgi:hypothetical protein